ncbi:TlyA family RNA methyltransferase [Demequina sp. B12]|nr:TlyA family RNA methyltransferase [Demequina sp. B12]MDE0573249.1 TlyA family RNA methyltransferase [Demequina sp. B12]
MRLDRALAMRGLARSRSHAQQLIDSGLVTVVGETRPKASTRVDDATVIEVGEGAAHYVSRAAHKLVGALDACSPLGLEVEGRDCLDAGASTGGFTQVLLDSGARHVTAVDVGHSQLASQIADDARVTVVERTNVKDLDTGSPGAGASLVVADLSFISLTHVVPALVRTAARDADFVLMVKPQFEVGRSKLSSRGVVTSHADRQAAVLAVASCMEAAGLTLHQVSRSPLPGPEGNVEFFVWGSGAWQASNRTGRPQLTGESLVSRISEEVTRP